VKTESSVRRRGKETRKRHREIDGVFRAVEVAYCRQFAASAAAGDDEKDEMDV